ncbi:MAG: hypothetical protein AAGA68_24280 [Pseudomonadota bacterium]
MKPRRDVLKAGLALCGAAVVGGCSSASAQGDGSGATAPPAPIADVPADDPPASPAARQSLVGTSASAEFTDVQSAIDAWPDVSPELPVVVRLEPGEFSPFTLRPGVTVLGAGRAVSTVDTSAGSPIRISADSSLQSLRVRYRGSDGGAQAAAIERTGPVTEAVLQDLEIDVTQISGAAGPRYAIGFYVGTHNLTLYDVKIRTESCGIYVSSGNYRFHGVDCYLAPGSTGVPHIGLEVVGGSRLDWYGGRLGTGYYYDQNLGDPGQDVIGALIPESNTQSNLRVQLRGLDIYARSADYTGVERVNAVRAENGWMRLEACRCQTEAGDAGPTGIFTWYGTDAQPSLGWGGKIELIGSRGNKGPGDVFGGDGELGVTGPVIDSLTLDEDQTGLILIDASSRDVAITLPWTRFKAGRRYTLKRVDESPNVVRVSSTANTPIDGMSERLLSPPSAEGSVLRVVAGRDQWHLL